jgi:hypothetical protein
MSEIPDSTPDGGHNSSDRHGRAAGEGVVDAPPVPARQHLIPDLDHFVSDHLNRARDDCCGDQRKPCSYHEGYEDAADVLLRAVVDAGLLIPAEELENALRGRADSDDWADEFRYERDKAESALVDLIDAMNENWDDGVCYVGPLHPAYMIACDLVAARLVRSDPPTEADV